MSLLTAISISKTSENDIHSGLHSTSYLVLEITGLFAIADVQLQKENGKKVFIKNKIKLALEQKRC